MYENIHTSLLVFKELCFIFKGRVKFRAYGNNMVMEKAVKSRKGLWIAVISAVVILLLGGLSFLPSIRGGSRATAVSYAAMNNDEGALCALGCCQAAVATRAFETSMTGAVKARVFGLPITQRVTGGRTVDGENFCERAESVSAFVKAGMLRECREGTLGAVRGAYKHKRFEYGKVQPLSRDSFIETYGKPNTALVKYELEGAVISAETIGENTYRYVLDPTRATAYCRNEVRTLLGSKSYPKYESVEFTLVTDGEFPLSVTVKEKFEADKFGGTKCSAEYTEVFTFK